jgi:hypothetical protein
MFRPHGHYQTHHHHKNAHRKFSFVYFCDDVPDVGRAAETCRMITLERAVFLQHNGCVCLFSLIDHKQINVWVEKGGFKAANSSENLVPICKTA